MKIEMYDVVFFWPDTRCSAANWPSAGRLRSNIGMTPRETDNPYAVIDIDGVVADVRHRLHHVEKRPKDWDAFFAAAHADAPLPAGLAVVTRLAVDHEIVYITGRPEQLRRATQGWLSLHGLPDGELIMRRRGDRRPARQVKVDLLRRLARRRAVGVLVDDDPSVCAAAAAAGFQVFLADWMEGTPVLNEAQELDGHT